MSYYDVFLTNPHSPAIGILLDRYNANMVRFFVDRSRVRQPRVLEIGPGKGYFYRALRRFAPRAAYTGIDRNPNILRALGTKKTIVATVPKLPSLRGVTYDLIYAGFLIEHLAGSEDIAALFSWCRRHLAPGGRLAVTFPDALSIGMQFWNEDYTHRYPTTQRNVGMAGRDTGFVVDVDAPVPVLGVAYGASPSVWKLTEALLRAGSWVYDYRFVSVLTGSRLSDMDNVWYRIHLLLKSRNRIMILRRS
jgi:SAM-dependent methyltransferase